MKTTCSKGTQNQRKKKCLDKNEEQFVHNLFSLRKKQDARSTNKYSPQILIQTSLIFNADNLLPCSRIF